MSYLKSKCFLAIPGVLSFIFLASCGTGVNVSSDMTNFPASPTTTFVASGLAGPAVVTSGGLTVLVRVTPNAFPSLSSQDDYQISDLYSELESQNILNR